MFKDFGKHLPNLVKEAGLKKWRWDLGQSETEEYLKRIIVVIG